MSGEKKQKKSAEKKRAAIWIILIALVISALAAGAWLYLKDSPVRLSDVKKSGEITVITRNSAHTYYIYRDEPMGFERDLAQAFADHLGVRLNVRVAEKWENMIPDLKNGQGAFIAASFTALPQRQALVAFSDPYMSIRQRVIVHRKNFRKQKMSDLSGRTVHVRKGTSYEFRLRELKEEGLDVEIRLHEDLPTEELIRMVANGEIDVTIADSNIALLNRKYYPEISMGEAISGAEKLAWAVDPKSDRLLEEINVFFETIRKNGEFDKIYNRYYKHAHDFDYVDMAVYHRRISTHLPLYEGIIKEAAKSHGFDWLMLAAQIYQESHFNPIAISSSGAYGLMQLTINTAKSLGITDILDPEQNVMTGARYLRNLYDLYKKAPAPDRLFIALAAYNIGRGHVSDAMGLARGMRLDPFKWSSLSKTLPLLRYRKYHSKTKYGYCRGNEPLQYVKQIMTYYDILKHMDMKLSGDGGKRPGDGEIRF
ncbi:Membrane-bound lytic murein transglycosylase F [Candidatus Desulfarcum epimagneticum]|uniref:Membrane-bound lytic murein transglycosylase F n=1 Tax=uncultured Desulfobacteraceae bacterium TaxID=218296 RepID=A0A484HFU4_9BACT|nr:Membrane-bound lytic murein transglycosylase F [uncultured Desulfobacteraceae bacterium]